MLSLRLERKTAAALVVAGAPVVAATAVVAACIPDLPADQSPPPGCGDGVVDLDAGEQCDPGALLTGEAGVGGCSASCRMQCPGGVVWEKNNHCYQAAALPAANLKNEADDRCFAFNSAHIVTFASADELAAVAEAFDAGAFWVGIQGGVSLATAPEPGWVPGCSGCYAETADASAPLPRSDAAPAPGPPQNCIEGFTDTDAQPSWLQYPCNDAPRLRVLCEREPIGNQWSPCDGGICIDLVVTHATKRYVYVVTPALPDDAESSCRSMGGQLVVLKSHEEREQLWLQLSRLAAVPEMIWIGLSLQPAHGDGGAQWVWDDGTPDGVYPSEWAANQPSGSSRTTRAVLWNQPGISSDTLAHDDVGATSLPYVCELPAASTP